MNLEYTERQACPALRPYVRCLWQLRGRGAQPARVFPDGCMELVFHFGDRFEVRADGDWQQQDRALAAGQIRRALELRPRGLADVLGIRFHPGGAHAFLRCPQQEMAGRIWALEDCWGAAARRLLERLGNTAAEERMARAERELLSLHPKPPADLRALSGRQYRRRFEEAVGLTPKLFERIQRFQRALHVVSQMPLAQAAIDCGYYDQPHMNRDFAEFAGITPAQWIRETRGVLFVQDDPAGGGVA